MESLLVPYLLTIQTRTMSEETRPFQKINDFELLELKHYFENPFSKHALFIKEKNISLINNEIYLRNKEQKDIEIKTN